MGNGHFYCTAGAATNRDDLAPVFVFAPRDTPPTIGFAIAHPGSALWALWDTLL